MDIADLLGKLSAVVGILAVIPYVRSILKGRTKPNRATWLIWSVVGVSILTSYHASGATTTIWLTVAYTFFPLIVFSLSFKYGVGGYEILDIVCLTGALIGLVLWKLTNIPELALYLSAAVDILGYLPTLKKIYLHPGSEDRLAWSMSAVAAILNMLAITSWQFKIILYPVYLLVTNTLAAGLLIHFQRRQKHT